VKNGHFPEGIEKLSAIPNHKARAIEAFPPKPLALPSPIVEVPSLDETLAKQMLPEPLALWAIDHSQRLCVPIESFAVLALSALSGVVGRQIGIQPKKNDTEWFELPCRWAAIIAPPSEKKSATLNEALRPIGILESRAKEEFQAHEATHRAAAMSIKAQMESVRETMKAAAKNDDSDGLKKAEESYAELEQKAKEAIYTEHRYRTSDSTIEKLGELLVQNPNGLLVTRDELSGWISGLERMGREQDRAFYLEAWSGKSSFPVDRIGRESLYIPALCLTLIGTIQPDRLKTLVYEAAQGTSGGDGLLQRFQLMVQPDRLPYSGIVDRAPHQEARERYQKLFEKLASLTPEEFGARGAPDEIQRVGFSEEAQSVFYVWLEAHEKKLRSGAIASPALEAHLGKYSGLMPALALLFHLIDGTEGRLQFGEQVSGQSAKRAAEWCRFLEVHAGRVYSLAEQPEFQGATELSKKIMSGRIKDGIPIREIYRPQWSFLKTSHQVDAAIEVLEKHGWLRREIAPTGGAPTHLIRLHPDLIPEGSGDVEV
jgi:hypothetical protein